MSGEVAVGGCPGGNKLDQEIFDAMTEFVTKLMHRGERLAERLDVPVSCMKALRRVDTSVSMKALGQLLHCDPSFVTMIADALERRGLAKREPGTVDRRVKNLVLTERGVEIKATLEQESRDLMPWAQALSMQEREQFLGLVRKMNEALATPAARAAMAVTATPAANGATAAEEVTDSTSTALPTI